MRFPTGLETSTFRREGHGDFNGTPTDESLKMINSNVQTPRAVHRNEEEKKRDAKCPPGLAAVDKYKNIKKIGKYKTKIKKKASQRKTSPGGDCGLAEILLRVGCLLFCRSPASAIEANERPLVSRTPSMADSRLRCRPYVLAAGVSFTERGVQLFGIRHLTWPSRNSWLPRPSTKPVVEPHRDSHLPLMR